MPTNCKKYFDDVDGDDNDDALKIDILGDDLKITGS